MVRQIALLSPTTVTSRFKIKKKNLVNTRIIFFNISIYLILKMNLIFN